MCYHLRYKTPCTWEDVQRYCEGTRSGLADLLSCTDCAPVCVRFATRFSTEQINERRHIYTPIEQAYLSGMDSEMNEFVMRRPDADLSHVPWCVQARFARETAGHFVRNMEYDLWEAIYDENMAFTTWRREYVVRMKAWGECRRSAASPVARTLSLLPRAAIAEVWRLLGTSHSPRSPDELHLPPPGWLPSVIE